MSDTTTAASMDAPDTVVLAAEGLGKTYAEGSLNTPVLSSPRSTALTV